MGETNLNRTVRSQTIQNMARVIDSKLFNFFFNNQDKVKLKGKIPDPLSKKGMRVVRILAD